MVIKKTKTHLVKHKRTKKINYNNKKINRNKQVDRKNKKHYLTKYKLINKNNNRVQTGGDNHYYYRKKSNSRSAQDLYQVPNKNNLTIECENITDIDAKNECYNKLNNFLRHQMIKKNKSSYKNLNNISLYENLNSNSSYENLYSNNSPYVKLNNGTNKGYTKILPRKTNPGYRKLTPKTWQIKSGQWKHTRKPFT